MVDLGRQKRGYETEKHMVKPGVLIKDVSGNSENVFDQVLDISFIRSVSLQVTGVFVCSLVFEVSNGETPESSWTTLKVISGPGLYQIPLGYHFARVYCADYVSGSARVAAIFSQYDAPVAAATEEKQDAIIASQNLGELAPLLRSILQYLAYPGVLDKPNNATRIIPIGGTVTTVTGLTNIDGYQGKLVAINQNMSAWALSVRSRIS